MAARVQPLPVPAGPPETTARFLVRRELAVTLRMTAASLVLTGLAYPLAVTVLARGLFPARAGGSLVEWDGRAVGSELIGQRFTRPGYLQGRASAAGTEGYDPLASGGSNLGPTSAKLRARVRRDVKRLQESNPNAPGPVPLELVTTSASGLDPHLSPEAALWQVPRIAAARGLSEERVASVIRSRIEDRTFGVLGEPRVNVLRVNLDLDARFGAPAASP